VSPADDDNEAGPRRDGAAALAERPSALAERPDKLPKLLKPRQVSMRAIAVVLAAELAVFLGWFATGMTWLSFALLFAGLFTWSFRRRADVHRTLTSSERARELLDLGNVEESEQLLDQLLASRRTPPNVRPFAAYYRALVAARRGEFEQARARLQAVIDSGWLGNRRTLQNLAPAVYASAMLIAVLEGDLASAQRWRDEGQRCAANLERHWFLPDSFMLARRNAWTELLRKLETNWDAIEGTVSGVGIRQLQMLEAYALARLGEREDNYRGHHSGREISALLHGIRPGRFDYLAHRWPELREFMLAHHLLAPE
jgi:tetratricopeptide (TPR) repeat protein